MPGDTQDPCEGSGQTWVSVWRTFLSLSAFPGLFDHFKIAQRIITTTVLCRIIDFLFFFIFISWRLITLQYCSGFLPYIDMNQPWIYMCSPFWSPPPPASLPIPSLWVFPVHQPWALVSCIQPGLVICFTLDKIHVSMLFSWNIPPSPSPTESKSLFCTSVSLFLFCISGYHYHLSKFHIYVLVHCIGVYLSGLLHSV